MCDYIIGVDFGITDNLPTYSMLLKKDDYFKVIECGRIDEFDFNKLLNDKNIYTFGKG